jgi:16S rRNA processing protein RimM
LSSTSARGPLSDGWTTIAALVKPRGNKGELTAVSLSSKPERFLNLTQVHLFGDGAEYTAGAEYSVERIWNHDGALIFKFAGIDSINDAEKLRGLEVRVPFEERAPLEDGEYYQSDLVGCEVRDLTTNRLIGTVTGWEEYGGPALLDVDNGRILIPFVKAICPEIDPANRVIRVQLPDGLEDLGKA